MIWMLPLIGAAAGALMNKKAPIKGAIMGAGMGALGGAGLGAMGAGGGLLGGGAAAGSQAGMLAAQEAGIGLGGTMGWGGATTGMQGLLNGAGGAQGLLGTASNAAKTASTVNSLMPQEQPVPTAPPFTSGGGTQMGGVYQSMQQNRLAQREADKMARQLRQQYLSRIG